MEQARTEPRWSVPLSDLLVDDVVLAAAREALESGWWTMGPRVHRFEAAFAAFCGTRHAIAVSSGTAALHLALVAAGCQTDDEVVLPTLNFVAAANAVVHTGATPVYCDIRGLDDLNLDPDDVEAAVTERTKAIIVLHYGGFPCDMDAVGEIAGRHGLIVIEDAAHAPGATWRGRRCGAIGDIGCFSFFSNKNLPIGEGGMVVTDDDRLADRIRLLRSHGMTTLTWERHRGHASSYDVVTPGFNQRMDEVRAAVGLAQLDRLGSWNTARAQIAARYRAVLEGVYGLAIPFAAEAPDSSSSHHLATVVLPDEVRRASVQAALAANAVQTSVHYPPVHRFSQYKPIVRRILPRTEAAGDRLLTLPLFPHMHDGQVELVTQALLRAIRDKR